MDLTDSTRRPVFFGLVAAALAATLGQVPSQLTGYIHLPEGLLAVGLPLLVGFFVYAVTLILLARRGHAGFKVALTVLGIWLVVCPVVAGVETFVLLHLLPPIRFEVDGVMREYPRYAPIQVLRASLRGAIIVGGALLGLVRGAGWGLRRAAASSRPLTSQRPPA